MISTMVASDTMTYDVAQKAKGFGRGWGHGQKYKKSDKYRQNEKPKKYKEFKLERVGKFASFDEEEYIALADTVYLNPRKFDDFDTMSDASQITFAKDRLHQSVFEWFESFFGGKV